MKNKFITYTEDTVEKARKLRMEGSSFKKISKDLGLSHSTAHRWCLDIKSHNKCFLDHCEIREKLEKSEEKIVKNLKKNRDYAKLITSLLYWAEGTKYPHSSSVSFSNSDPQMIKTFIFFLRKGFKLNESKFRVHLQIHTTHDKKEIFNFWSKLLQIPLSNFWKPTITKPTKKAKRRDYFGTCTLRYHDYKILLKIMGIYKKIGEVAERLKAAGC